MPNRQSILRIKGLILSISTFLFTGLAAHALDASYYAENSVLSTGQWAKVEVSETGMQYISDATIRSLGFSDPDKVNVYGYGGVVIEENLDSPDDLPVVPSMRVNGGIVFFGRGNAGWSYNGEVARLYLHKSHPYSDAAYYFLSDVEPQRLAPEKSSVLTASDPEIVTEFMERLLHEQDLFMVAQTGRVMLGEDFKTTTSRNFQFPLQGNVGDAVVTVAFGSKTSGSASSLVLTANGKQLTASSSDKLTNTDSKLYTTTVTTKEVSAPGNNLDLGIKFNPSGNIISAGLDYIEVLYPRALNMATGELYFYLLSDDPREVRIEGATPNAVIWDVTDPQNPRLLESSLNGTTLSFVCNRGYREYVAFEPSRISRAAIAGDRVQNQNIHGMPAPGLLVISPQEYLSAAQRLVTLHQQTDGLDVLVLTPEDIYNEFSCGKPDVTAFRKLLKMWYDRAEGEEGKFTEYCLIMSRPTYDNKLVTTTVKNAGYPRVPIYQSPTGETATTSYSTDDYIGMLEDVKGSFNIGTAKINVAVGRFPVKSLNEANMAMDKLEAYLLEPELGSWRNNLMIIADDQDNGVHLEQAENVVAAIQASELGQQYMIEKLYLDSYPLEYTGTGASYPQAHERMMNKWNEGVAYIGYIGHANEKSWSHEYLLNWTDINSFSNPRLPIIFAATCEFMRWDEDETSGGEIIWLLPSSGTIAMICPSREVLISANGIFNTTAANYIFATDEDGNPIRFGKLMIQGKNESNTGTNKLRYGLIGDPSMRMPWPKLNVVADEINGVKLEDVEELPIVKARSTVKVSGHIEDPDGGLLSDFNGIVEIAMYDAEKVITTNGNGTNGVQSVYNDRKTRLYAGRVKVVNGEWSTDFTMPSEIENNYAPALLSMYAYDESGREANGACDKLYAYGYDETAPDDFEGPKIIEFYLDHPGFVSGSQVSPSPTLTATFYDESGISVSEAGIGHNLTLSLDGTTYFDDFSQYYIPDENDSRAGSVTYPLTDITQGSHTLKLIVWDNANNSSTASLDFNISPLWKPSIETLTTDVNPATTSVNFIIATDGATSAMECSIEVYDIWGRKVWRSDAPSLTKGSPRTTLGWDLSDFGGGRIPGGVYLYRATVKTETGATVTKTKKLMVKGL